MTPEQLKEIKDRLGAATPGPWGYTAQITLSSINRSKVFRYTGAMRRPGAHIMVPAMVRGEKPICDCGKSENDSFQANRNATFIAHAPSDIAALLGEVERLRKALTEIGDCMGKAVNDSTNLLRAVRLARAALGREENK